METRWENEGGKPYEKIDFSVVNPQYFEFADRRIKHLVDAGMVPVIMVPLAAGIIGLIASVIAAERNLRW